MYRLRKTIDNQSGVRGIDMHAPKASCLLAFIMRLAMLRIWLSLAAGLR